MSDGNIQSRTGFLFTIFGCDRLVYNEDRLRQYRVKYCIWQLERCPSTGRQHIQGYVEFNRSASARKVKEAFEDNAMHVEGRRGNREQAIAYCSKSETRISGPYEIFSENRYISQGARTDIDSLLSSIRAKRPIAEVIDDHLKTLVKYPKLLDNYYHFESMKVGNKFDPEKEVIVYYGPPGSGKTRCVINEEPDVCALDTISNGKVWLQGYYGQDALLIDDFDGQIPLTQMLRIMDKYPYTFEYKGGSIRVNFKKVYITSNYHPSEWYPNAYQSQKDAILRRIDHINKFD